jgi:Uma2 family endonuclease
MEASMVIASPVAPKLLSTEEFLALPDDGKDRFLIRGRIYPEEPTMTVRNRKHSRTEANITHLLKSWLDGRPEPRGEIHSGDAGFRLRRDPDSLVGIDVAFVSPELAKASSDDSPFHDGPPVLAVEILSPSDKHEDVVERINAYLNAGVVVWEVDPDFRTVRVHKPGEEPETINVRGEISGEPYLPGFRASMARFFGG